MSGKCQGTLRYRTAVLDARCWRAANIDGSITDVPIQVERLRLVYSQDLGLLAVVELAKRHRASTALSKRYWPGGWPEPAQRGLP